MDLFRNSSISWSYKCNL